MVEIYIHFQTQNIFKTIPFGATYLYTLYLFLQQQFSEAFYLSLADDHFKFTLQRQHAKKIFHSTL